MPMRSEILLATVIRQGWSQDGMTLLVHQTWIWTSRQRYPVPFRVPQFVLGFVKC